MLGLHSFQLPMFIFIHIFPLLLFFFLTDNGHLGSELWKSRMETSFETTQALEPLMS